MKIITIKQVSYNSEDYKKTVKLRDKILRKPLGLKFSPEQLEKEYLDIHIACFNGQDLIGCLIFSPVDDVTFQMRQVAVDENYQGKQIGTTIVKYSEEFAISNGIQKIILHAREVAVPFYLNLGYKKIGEQFVEIGLPHWMMEKRLENN